MDVQCSPLPGGWATVAIQPATQWGSGPRVPRWTALSKIPLPHTPARVHSFWVRRRPGRWLRGGTTRNTMPTSGVGGSEVKSEEWGKGGGGAGQVGKGGVGGRSGWCLTCVANSTQGLPGVDRGATWALFNGQQVAWVQSTSKGVGPPDSTSCHTVYSICSIKLILY